MVHLETTCDGIQRQFETKVDVKLFWLFLLCSFLQSLFLYCYSVLNVRQCMKGTHCSDDTALLLQPSVVIQYQVSRNNCSVLICNFKKKIGSHAIKKCIGCI